MKSVTAYVALLATTAEAFTPARINRALAPVKKPQQDDRQAVVLNPSSRETAGEGGLNFAGLASDIRVVGFAGLAAASILGIVAQGPLPSVTAPAGAGSAPPAAMSKEDKAAAASAAKAAKAEKAAADKAAQQAKAEENAKKTAEIKAAAAEKVGIRSFCRVMILWFVSRLFFLITAVCIGSIPGNRPQRQRRRRMQKVL